MHIYVLSPVHPQDTKYLNISKIQSHEASDNSGSTNPVKTTA